MEVTDQEVILDEGIAIRWDAIRTIRMGQNKLILDVQGGLTAEITGLSPKSIDQIFGSYYRYINRHPISAPA